MGPKRFSDLSKVPKPSEKRQKWKSGFLIFTPGSYEKWCSSEQLCCGLRTASLPGGWGSSVLMASCQDKIVSVQFDCFLGSHWLHISWPSQLIVWWYHCIECTIQWSNKPIKWNMYRALLQKEKRTRAWEENSFIRSLSRPLNWTLYLCWIWLGLVNGMW